MGESQHALTTPKGATALTVILAVIGVFTPFFTSLEAAQLFAAAAIFVIAWLYHEEIVDCVSGRASFGGLITPAIAVLVILLVVVGSTLALKGRPVVMPTPALTIDDVKQAVQDVVQNEDDEHLPTLSPPSQNRPIVIQEPALDFPPDDAPNAPAKPSPNSSPAPKPDPFLDSLKKKIARAEAGSKEWSECLGEQTKITVGLYKLINSAVEMQNAYYYGKNDKKMVADLASWTNDVKSYFSSNKVNATQVQVFDLASQGQDYRGFLDTHAAGKRAWAEMDAKVKALEAIQKQIAASHNCDDVRNAAVVKCVEDGTCG